MASGRKTLQPVLYILIVSSCIEFVQSAVEVQLETGYHRGTTITTRKGRKIQAFLALRYAQPPVGNLRFKNPAKIRESSFDTIMNDKDGNQCPQIDSDGSVVGDEDCLYLNVYTPQTLNISNPVLYPVMMFIHGGQFVRGSGSSEIFGPQYLLDKDIVLVTINYRLGPLGFFTTGDSQASGNFGLKDQVLALRWIRENIIYFHGNPRNVTIFGQEAGGVSANLHTVSDSSDGLFKQFISQSGVLMNYWGWNNRSKAVQHGINLGAHLGCPTSNSKQLIDCLRNATVSSLINSNSIFKNELYRTHTWAPSEEPREVPGGFLNIFPFHALLMKTNRKYHGIIGNVIDEGLFLTAQFYTNNGFYEKIANNFDNFLSRISALSLRDSRPKVYAKRIKDFYFNGTQPSDKEIFTRNMTNLITDAAFLKDSDFVTRAMQVASNSTIHFYSFEYRGSHSETSRVIGNNTNVGVTNADELQYIFPMGEMNESDEQMIDTMVDLWTSFATTGIPNTDRFPDSNYWKTYGDNATYLQIGDDESTMVTLHEKFNRDRLHFWHTQFAHQLIGGFLQASTHS